MVETVSSCRSAMALSQRWGDRTAGENTPLKVMLQVNTSGEESEHCWIHVLVVYMLLHLEMSIQNDGRTISWQRSGYTTLGGACSGLPQLYVIMLLMMLIEYVLLMTNHFDFHVHMLTCQSMYMYSGISQACLFSTVRSKSILLIMVVLSWRQFNCHAYSTSKLTLFILQGSLWRSSAVPNPSWDSLPQSSLLSTASLCALSFWCCYVMPIIRSIVLLLL